MKSFFLICLLQWAFLSVAIDLSAIPKTVRSANGFVQVVAADVPGDELGFRTPILLFASREVENLAHAYGFNVVKGKEPSLIIYAEGGFTNDARVITRFTWRQKKPLTRIWLPSPGYSDMDKLRFEIARAFFAAQCAHAQLPDWLIQGALRAADPQTLKEDNIFVTLLWRRGKLPYFPALCTDLRFAQGKAAALSGYLVGWMKEKHLFRQEFERLAAGGTWDGTRLAEALTGETDGASQDRAQDERLIRLARGVQVPGATTPLDLDNFTSRLFLYPRLGAYGKLSEPLPFFEAGDTHFRTNRLVKAAAREKARKMSAFAIGRDNRLKEACAAYIQYLIALSAQDNAVDIVPLITAAREKISTFENKGVP